MKKYRMRPLLSWFRIVAVLIGLAASGGTVWADDTEARQGRSSSDSQCTASTSLHDGLEGVQIETSDIGLHERFFSQILHAPEVQRMDHPQIDSLRSYCYRNVLIAIRQDIKTPRPTGWVQLNFSVADVGQLQQEFEHVVQESDLAQLDDAERAKVVRVRFKPDVPRNNCRVARLEVNGPEGFMLGFDQFKEGSCKTDGKPTQSDEREPRRPHH
jgi:hypothetical protein